MGTSNYHYEEVFFAVNDGDEFTWEDTRDNIAATLKSESWFTIDDTKRVPSELRSFPATSIGEFYDSVEVLGQVINISVLVMTRSGYYEGFNLDRETSIDYEYTTWNNGQEVWQDMWDCNYVNHGLLTIHKDLVINSIDEMVKGFQDKVDEAFKMYSDEMKTVGRFSDGTSLIEKVS